MNDMSRLRVRDLWDSTHSHPWDGLADSLQSRYRL